MNPEELSSRILSDCRCEGFALSGIAPLTSLSRQEILQEWVAQGKHGGMAYMAEQLAERLDPTRVLEGAKSAIVVADQYAPRGSEDSPEFGQGRIARYARGRDYHEFIKKRLRRLCQGWRPFVGTHRFRACIDTAPVRERELAAIAGVGWIGKNTMLIHPERGSWLLLGVILTTLDLGEETPVPDHCGTCTRCIDACPTAAITDHSVDATRCISYLTIEHREQIEPALHAGIGDWILGCDICQEVCPHNSGTGKGSIQAAWKPIAKRTTTAPLPGVWGTPPAPDAIVDPEAEIQPAYAPRRVSLPLLDILGWNEDTRREAFATSAMKRVTLAMLQRNAMIVATNQTLRTSDPELTAALVPTLQAMASDHSQPELVRRTAAQCLQRLHADLNGAPPAAPAE
ncbi:MAG: tRNA epoxyqueuosine(34) reductase QueG [Planctomycetes bacterium]|nr:tRNA epoxyqueuosine(34) reductase QueG [Planctomycetota bacterium]